MPSLRSNVSLFLLAFASSGLACNAGSDGDTSSTPASDDAELQASTLVAPHASAWKYSLSLPYAQLDPRQQGFYRSALPLEAVGAVKTTLAPFRATAMYLGTLEGVALFGVAEHVALDRKPIAVELGHLGSAPKFEIPVEERPLFSSVSGDFAILRAKADAPPEALARLAAIKPVTLSFAPVAAIHARHPSATYVVVGRASHPSALGDIAANPPLWPTSAVASWNAAASEAAANLDERPDASARQGDVLAIAPAPVVARGATQELRDPDGLRIGSDVATPFLATRADWAPESVAFTYRSAGRMSGSPIFCVARGRRAVVVAVHWTKGVGEDLSPLLPLVAESPSRAFGRVVMKRAEDGTLKLGLEQTAPFAYASALARAGSDLRLFLTNTTVDLDAGERAALQKLADDAFDRSTDLLP